MKKLHIVFNGLTGKAVPDMKSMDFAIAELENFNLPTQSGNIIITCGNSLMVDAFRVLLKEGKIDPNDIVFYDKVMSEETAMRFDKDARSWDYGKFPEFCSEFEKMARLLL